MVYLGGILSGDGRVESELGRRIGLAQADFNALKRVWNHASLSKQKKFRIFDACIQSKLHYGLHPAWLNTAARRRIDGFQARCLRRVLGIPPESRMQMSWSRQER